MSEEQLKAFLEKVKSDTKLQEKLGAAITTEEALALAKDAGFLITSEDVQSMQSATDLSDDELENIAGGRRNPNQCGTCAPYQSNCQATPR